MMMVGDRMNVRSLVTGRDGMEWEREIGDALFLLLLPSLLHSVFLLLHAMFLLPDGFGRERERKEASYCSSERAGQCCLEEKEEVMKIVKN